MSLGYGPRAVSDNVVLWYDAANIKSYPGTGSVWYDMSGNGYHASDNDATVSYDATEKAWDFVGGVILESGMPISGLNYVTGSSDQLTNITLETWFKNNSGTTNSQYDERIILSFDRSSVFRWAVGGLSGAAGKPSFMFIGTGGQMDTYATQYSGDLRDDQWHHLVTTFASGGNGLKHYIDGELVHTDNTNYSAIGNHGEDETPRYGVIGSGSERSTEGDQTSSPDCVFYGKIAVLRYYYKTFTADEVAKNFHALRGRFGI